MYVGGDPMGVGLKPDPGWLVGGWLVGVENSILVSWFFENSILVEVYQVVSRG